MRNVGSTRTSLLAALVATFALWSVPARARVCAGPTRLVALAGNLQADAPLIPGGFDGASTLEAAFGAANFTASVEISDKLGHAHEILFFFTRVASDRWTLNVGVQGSEMGGAPDALVRTAPGRSLRFNAHGVLRAGRWTRTRATFSGAGRQQINLDLSGMTQKRLPTLIDSPTALP
jgi:hypothetical protein